MELNDYLKKYYPKTFFEYKRFLAYNFEMLKPGTKLLMLRSGFCGGAGVVRTVLSIQENRSGEYAELEGGEGISLLYKSNYAPWWRECYVFSDEESCRIYQELSRKEQTEWQATNLGFILGS